MSNRKVTPSSVYREATSEILSRLHSGRRPSGRDLADAAVIEKWSLLLTEGPYLLVGVLGERRKIAEPVMALDLSTGWARLTDRWLILGEPIPGADRRVTPAEVMSRAALWLARMDADPN